MNAFNESIVEDAALSWFGELGYTIGHGPHLAPGEPSAERDSFGERAPPGRGRSVSSSIQTIRNNNWHAANKTLLKI
jgi:hypothetical protein